MIPNRPLSEIWHEYASKWVDAEAEASRLEDFKSAVFSQLCLKSDEKSVARAEMTVRASPTWQTYLAEMTDARTKANRAKIDAEKIRLQFKERESEEFNHRMGAKL